MQQATQPGSGTDAQRLGGLPEQPGQGMTAAPETDKVTIAFPATRAIDDAGTSTAVRNDDS